MMHNFEINTDVGNIGDSVKARTRDGSNRRHQQRNDIVPHKVHEKSKYEKAIDEIIDDVRRKKKNKKHKE